MSPLLNCPFCGGEAKTQDGRYGYRTWVGCQNGGCVMRPSSQFHSEAGAIAAWNRRAPPEQSAAGHPVAVDGGTQAASEASELKDAPAAINRSGEP